MPTSPRLAPTQKLRAWLAITRPAQSPLSSSWRALAPSSTTAASMALAGACSSKQSTPSPRSTRLAEPFPATLAPLGLEPVQVDDLRVGRDRLVGAGQGAVDLAVAVEGLVPGGQHLGDPGRDLDAEGLHAGHPVGHADGVPGPERPQLVAEAPLDGVVDLDQRVGDLRHPAGGVGQRRQQGVAQVAGAAVLLGLVEQEAQAVRPGRRGRGRRPTIGRSGLGRRPVLQGVQVEHVEHGLAVAPAAAVEAAAGLVAEQPGLQHPPQRLGGREDVAALVGGGQLVQVAGHGDHHVQPDLVEQPEGGRLGPAHQRPGEGVDLLDRVAVLQGVADVVHAGEAAQPVGDEVGGVLGHHRALAQHPLHERPHPLQHLGVGVGGRDELDQLEVAGRVEEVGATGTGAGSRPSGPRPGWPAAARRCWR